ncbi:MAG: dihydrodipicolinate synthase family protein [Nakamurella sp.]
MAQASPLLAALDGVCPIPAVPFTQDEGLDVDSFLAGIADIAAAGAKSLMWPGFASEYHKLSDAEVTLLRTELMAAARSHGLRVIIAVQDHATRLAIDNGLAALDAGAVGINLLPPHFLRPSAQQVSDHISAVCAALGDGELVLQFAPGFTGSTLTLDHIVELAAAQHNLRAVKVETSSPGPAIRRLTAAGLAATVGAAGLQLIEAFEAGAVGVQPGAGFVRLYLQIWAQLVAGRSAEARAAHTALLPAIGRWMDSVEHILSADKAVLQRRGVFRTATVRRPGRALDPEDEALVASIIEALGRCQE